MKFPYNRSDITLIVISIAFVAAGVITYSEEGIPWGTIFFGFCLLVSLFEPIRRKNQETDDVHKNEFVEFDKIGIKRVVPNSIEEYILWKDIDEIAITTSDEGPFVDDLHWMLMNQDKTKGVAISNDAEGFSELLTEFQGLQGFNNEAVIQAMGCADNNWFVVWKNVT
ncbi:hypothetical protein [Pseudoalteromonas sp. T1lg23B]|uniref:hypothetical protein n=1 Tax=Pseudoalteromonas sp. T1lg23B TaxID=2077097 RepID=UPI001319CA4C|nr:hypothetical protein [Pseudoalteromonas sp. T1lg23B]